MFWEACSHSERESFFSRGHVVRTCLCSERFSAALQRRCHLKNLLMPLSYWEGFQEGKRPIKAFGETALGPLRSENAPLTLMGSFFFFGHPAMVENGPSKFLRGLLSPLKLFWPFPHDFNLLLVVTHGHGSGASQPGQLTLSWGMKRPTWCHRTLAADLWWRQCCPGPEVVSVIPQICRENTPRVSQGISFGILNLMSIIGRLIFIHLPALEVYKNQCPNHSKPPAAIMGPNFSKLVSKFWKLVSQRNRCTNSPNIFTNFPKIFTNFPKIILK